MGQGRQGDDDREVPRYARAAARLLVPSERDAGSARPGEREQAVEALAAALQARARRRVRRRWSLVGAAAAAVVVLAIGAFTSMRSGGFRAHVEGGGSLQPGSVVLADGGHPVAVSLSTGTRLRLAGGGRLEVVELGHRQRFLLRSGQVWAKVAALTADQRFVVSTPDAEIEVRGTAFSVAVVPAPRECDGVATEVRVTEGLVTVRRNGQRWQVGAGQRWPGVCPEPAARTQAASSLPAPPRRPQAPRPSASTPRAVAPSSREQAVSTLAQQNDLFAAAMQARRRGDLVETRRRLDELLTRFPFGPLAESARIERAKLPRRGNPTAPSL
jgi:hypothetical protein